MRDDNDNAAACTDAEDRSGQSLVALTVEIGIRFIENHKERIAVERPRERDALALSG